MANLPDDITWIPESRMLSLCKLPRSTFQSWVRSGLDLSSPGAAYGLAEVVAMVLLVASREHLAAAEMISAWRALEQSGKFAEIVTAARQLEAGDCFDLVVDPEHASFVVARNDGELAEAVRHPNWPRPVVVLDLAERTREIVGAFHRLANATPRPKARAPGRPRKADRAVRLVATEDGM